MKLRAKIFPKYFEEVKSGKKDVEFRQLETITLINTETGEEIEFEILDAEKYKLLSELKTKYPDVDWKPELPTLKIKLGKRVGKARQARLPE